ncbi:GAF domain-containing protein [Leptolyngbya sp. FACHB-321]|uniref:ATP-binding protein n=1 Tax=Leptolyngbya sp. FACHB-321 TaxID=2692807 RepID=UPI001686F514|nr:ATP-binding protein [Leptolyngbya sp. FACHB-321]MBD2034887.1 GAF domain-containing protein [Leptolyngbya sp. FACHB-321]
MVERRQAVVAHGLTQGNLLNRMTNRIRQTLELQEILAATVAEVQSFLGTDRVKIYRFQADGTGQVIAEATRPDRLPSLLGLHFPAGDIPPHARELFIKARQRSIIDIPSQRITLSRLEQPRTTGDLTVDDVHNFPLEDILSRPVDPCHVEYLTAMGVQSSLVIPIFHRQDLWGLLVSHHATPKRFSEKRLQTVQLVADHVSIAIAQSQLLTNTRAKASREAVINQISTLLHSPMPSYEVLQLVLEQAVKVNGCVAGRLYVAANEADAISQLYITGPQPESANCEQLLETTPFWQQLLVSDTQPNQQVERLAAEPTELSLTNHNQDWMAVKNSGDDQPQAVTDIYQEPLLETVLPAFSETQIRGLLVMPLRYGELPLGCLTLFRNEIDTNILWAGRFDSDERNQRVRESFEVWQELKQHQAQPWATGEIELVRSLGTHLAMAIMQNRLYRCEREQRILVEMRNRELNVARTSAEEASRLKSDFLSSTSHELRTPLASTLNYLELLKEGLYDNEEELQEYINVAYHSAENLVDIINDILDIAKIEAGRMYIQWETVNLRELLQHQERLFKPESRQKGIPLLIDCQVEYVRADLVKLRQVLTNLLANAFKFTNAGEVRLCVKRCIQTINQSPQSVIEFAVTDTGIGIDREDANSLFEPFVQADGSIKRRYGGTGLGLTICKRLVELLNGQIWLHSPGKGKGTTITFTLPDRPL